jgi:CHASE2 domain-containing sensor protein/predicted Ser/Thr protein kinase
VAAKLARFSWLPGGLAAALVVAVGRLLSSTSSAPLELAAYDRVMRAVDVTPSPEVVIVGIDNDSIERLGEWPWPRDVHASLLDRLRSEGARVVAFTVPFDTAARTTEAERLRAALALLESSELGDSQQARQLRALLGESAAARDPNAHLAGAMVAHGNVILPVELRVGERQTAGSDLPSSFLLEPTSALTRAATSGAVVQRPDAVFTEAATGVGHTLLVPDANGTLRTDVIAIRTGNAMIPSMATAIAARAAGISPAEIALDEHSMRIESRRVAIESGLRTRPHYFPPSGSHAFVQYPYWKVLAGEVPSVQLRGKVVLIGFVGGTASRVTTPIAPSTPTVAAIASAASSLITGHTYSRPAYATAIEWAAGIIVVLVAAFVLPSAGVVLGTLALLLLIAMLIVTEVGLLSSSHVWVRLMLPCVAAVAGYGLYVLGELIRRANSRGDAARDSGGNLRNLGQTFQQQGQLDLAFETYQRCPLDAPTMEVLYALGLDFEKRRQLQKAGSVYSYIATRDPNYRDLHARRARVSEAATSPPPLTRPVGSIAPVATTRRPATEPDMPRSSGRVLGRYELERELGKGAMGTVYLGRDPHINRVVAIKAIPLAEEFEEQDLAEARARFFREAEMAGRLNHPSIVTVYDAGEDQGLAYIAMEYLRGQHLSHFTDANRLLPPKSVMLLVARVAEALHYAHRQNVVHRDIKPANIMFNPDTDELKITDFGIARLTDTSRTKTGIVLGTPSFMSPEQLEGRTLDGRSDQFALGVSLYQLLCGQLPFRAESMPRLMQKIATEPHASVRVLRPELPECIDSIIERVLAKSADDRYPNCAQLADALRRCAGPQAESEGAEPKHEWLIP